MINLRLVESEMGQITDQLHDPKLKKGQMTKLKGRLSFLKQVVAYLESGPSDEFLGLEITKISKRINLIREQFPAWVPNKYFEKEKDKLKEYEKETGVPKLRNQLKALRYISNT